MNAMNFWNSMDVLPAGCLSLPTMPRWHRRLSLSARNVFALGYAAKRAFSALSTSLLLLAVVAAVVSTLASVVWDYEPIWRVANWICGISVVALVVNPINNARK